MIARPIPLETDSIRTLAPGRGRKRKGPSPLEPGPSSEVGLELFVDLRLRRRGGRSITFTEALAASLIAPLDETGSQVIAPAIAADQFLQLRLASRLLPERPCGLGLIPDSSVRGRCCGVSDRLALASLGQFRGFHFAPESS